MNKNINLFDTFGVPDMPNYFCIISVKFFRLFFLSLSFQGFLISNVFAITCPIRATKEVINYAKERGYTIDVQKESADQNGSCAFSDLGPHVVTGVAGAEQSITCHIKYFEGKQLQPGWLLGDFRFLGDFEYEESTPHRDTPNPLVKVKFLVDKNKDKTLILESIILKGPRCDKWQEAFR